MCINIIIFIYTRKNAQVGTSLQTSCNKSVHKLSTSCFRTACSLFVVTLSDLLQGCSNKSDTVMYNKNVTRLTTQGCSNIILVKLCGNTT